MKKVLSLVLVIAMVLSSMSFAFASTFEDVTGDYEDAINTLAGLGVITGYEDGTYRPEKVVTRAEMAKLMVQILGYGDLVAGAKSNFKDTQGHWADAYIALAAGRGIVIGDGNGNFRPDATVTYNEVLTMVVRGLGYSDDSNEIKNMTWPTNFKVKAAELGITDGVKMSTSGADRGGVAQALFNALDATLVSVNTDGDVTYLKDSANENKALLSRIANKVGTEADPYVVSTDKIDPSSKNYAGNIVDLKAYLYENLQVYVSKNDTDKVVYVAKSYSDTVTGTFKANNPSTGTADNSKVNVKLSDDSTETYNITTAVKVYYNGSQVDLTESKMEDGATDVVSLVDAKVKFVYDDNDNVKAVVADKATYAYRITREYKTDSLTLGKINLPVKGDDVNLSKVTVTGEVDDIYDIEEDDIVVAYAGKGATSTQVPNVLNLVVVRDTVEGKITEVNDDYTKVYIDGKEFKVSKIAGKLDTFEVGNEGTFFLDDAGKVFAKEASTASDAKDFAVIIQAYNGQKSSDGSRYLAKPEIKLINAKGEVVTYVVNKDAKFKDGVTLVLGDHATYGTKTVISTVGSRSLVKFKLNSDNEITKLDVLDVDVLTVATGDQSKLSAVDTTKAAFEVAENAPVFSVKPAALTTAGATDKDNYSVVDVENLPKEINIFYREINSDGEYKVIVSDNAETSNNNFALIVSRGYMINDDDDKVEKVTAYINGVKTVIEAEAGITVTSSAIDTGVITKLTLDDGKLSADVTTAFGTTLNTLITKDITKSTSARIGVATRDANGVVTSTTWVELEDDAVVYVLNSDYEFDSVGNAADLVGYEIVGLYDTDSTADGEINIIVVK